MANPIKKTITRAVMVELSPGHAIRAEHIVQLSVHNRGGRHSVRVAYKSPTTSGVFVLKCDSPSHAMAVFYRILADMNTEKVVTSAGI